MQFCLIFAAALTSLGFVGEPAYREARLAESKGNAKDALFAFRELAGSIGPLAAYARVKEGDCYRELGALADAEAAYRAVLAEKPEGPWARMAAAHLGMLLKEQGRHGEAAQVFAPLVAAPVHPWWTERFVWAAHENNTRTPEGREAAYGYFGNVLATNIFRAKRRDAARMLAQSPSFDDRLLGVIGLSRTDEGAAGAALLRTLFAEASSDPARAQHAAYVNGALNLGATADLPKAASLTNAPDAQWVRMAMVARIDYVGARGEFAEAQTLANGIMAKWPQSEEAVEGLFRLILALGRKGQHRDEIKVCALLAETYPKHRRAPEVLYRAAQTAERHFGKDEAIAYYELLAQRHPTSRVAAEGSWRLAEMHKDDPNASGYIAALEQGTNGWLGTYDAHRAAQQLARIRPEDSPIAPLPAPSVRGLVAARVFPAWEEEPLPDGVAYDIRKLRLDFFGQLGFEEAEWEAFDLALSAPEGDWGRFMYRVMADAGLAHSATEYATASGWGLEDGLPTPERLRLYYARVHWSHVLALSRETGVDPYLILAVGRQESTFRPGLTSSAGAKGLMQVMPSTAKWMADTEPAISVDDIARLDDPHKSLRLGAFYLRRMLDMWDGNLAYALASYNGGPGNVRKWTRANGNLPLDRWIEAIPFAETQDYVKRVLGNYAAYYSLYGTLGAEGTGAGAAPQVAEQGNS